MSLAQFGQYPAPRYTIAHISDTHLLADGMPHHGSIDTDAHLVRALELLGQVETPPHAIILSGDLTDRGEPAAYARVKELVGESAEALGAAVIWAIGNHDDRWAYSSALFEEASTAPQDRVHDLDGLRIISLDTTVPGYHHGALVPGQLEWLADVLTESAVHGSLLVMHHPPLPVALDRVSQVIELEAQAELGSVVRGTDVRAIVSGHLHFSTYGNFAGIPVFTASATCSTMQLAGPGRSYGVNDASQAIAMIQLFDSGAGGLPDAPITHTVLPLVDTALIAGHRFSEFAQLETVTDSRRREMFSKHRDRPER